MKFRLAGPSSSPVIGDAVRALVQLDDSHGAAVAISDLLAGIAETHAVPGTVVVVGPLNKPDPNDPCPDCGAYPACKVTS